ncbi:hypothetical protein [Bartonella sp. LJL80]
MISVLIHCDETIAPLADTLSMLVSGAVFGIIGEVVLWSENNHPHLSQIADDTGCTYRIETDTSEIVASAKGPWLLFLNSGDRLLDQWKEIVRRHIETERAAACFQNISAQRILSWRRLFGLNNPSAAGLLVRKDALPAVKSSQNQQAIWVKKLKPICLPVQMLSAQSH